MGSSDNPQSVDVVTIGETMVAFVGRPEERTYSPVLAGAESNVAVGMAALGHRTRWVSRLGDDRIGRSIADELVERGVDVDVVWDGDHPTGIMVKHLGGSHPERAYYRRGSAASALSTADLERLGPADWVHVTGITPALSASASALASALLGSRRNGRRVSFDVNLRPVLWDDMEEARTVLVPLARQADLVFIGDDEARLLVGTDDVDELADLLLCRDDQELVLKRGGGPATSVTRSSRITVAALPVPVVDVVGAGDAFTAGFLAGRCRGWRTAACLRLGHLLAARVIAVVEDVVPPLDPTEVARLTPEHLAALWDEAESATLR